MQPWLAPRHSHTTAKAYCLLTRIHLGSHRRVGRVGAAADGSLRAPTSFRWGSGSGLWPVAFDGKHATYSNAASLPRAWPLHLLQTTNTRQPQIAFDGLQSLSPSPCIRHGRPTPRASARCRRGPDCTPHPDCCHARLNCADYTTRTLRARGLPTC